jgi:hypothetical protein
MYYLQVFSCIIHGFFHRFFHSFFHAFFHSFFHLILSMFLECYTTDQLHYTTSESCCTCAADMSTGGVHMAMCTQQCAHGNVHTTMCTQQCAGVGVWVVICKSGGAFHISSLSCGRCLSAHVPWLRLLPNKFLPQSVQPPKTVMSSRGGAPPLSWLSLPPFSATSASLYHTSSLSFLASDSLHPALVCRRRC